MHCMPSSSIPSKFCFKQDFTLELVVIFQLIRKLPAFYLVETVLEMLVYLPDTRLSKSSLCGSDPCSQGVAPNDLFITTRQPFTEVFLHARHFVRPLLALAHAICTSLRHDIGPDSVIPHS